MFIDVGDFAVFIVTFRSAKNTVLREAPTFQLDDGWIDLGPRKVRIVAQPTATRSARGYVADVELMLARQPHVLRFERSEK